MGPGQKSQEPALRARTLPRRDLFGFAAPALLSCIHRWGAVRHQRGSLSSRRQAQL